MADFRFQQVDVFTATPLKGNPLAVVVEADGLRDEEMAAFANWTNLSETAFLLRPTMTGADYRVRIFTPAAELPFAGHPTLGSCHVWLGNGGQPKGDEIVQQCEAGLIRIRQDEGRLAFAAPVMMRCVVEPEIMLQVAKALRIPTARMVAAQWLGKRPAWIGVLLRNRDEVLALQPDFGAMAGLEIGVIAPSDSGETQFEVRGFAPDLGIREDPVTGSLNAGLAHWLIGEGRAPRRYVAAQGICIGRAGRVYISQSGADIWVGGHVMNCIAGTLTL